MVVLIAKNTVKEGLQQEFLKLAKEMTVKTRQEKGCISYDLASDQSDAQVFYFIEKYQDEKAVEFHRATEYFRTLVPQIGALREALRGQHLHRCGITINRRKTEMKYEGKNKKRVRNGGENMKFEAMFQPIQIGPMTVANRFVMSPMGNNFANTDGTMSERSASYYGARAKGGFGLITFEATVVYKEAKGGPRKPCLYDDSAVSSFQAAIAACHQAGAKVSIQLQHAGPEGNTKITGYPLKAASAIPASCGRETPEAITKEELYRLIECYGDAAVRAKKAGADAVEIHCAHGYLVSTFISARTNKRVDEFGGSFENRMRLPKLIIENIRKKAGDSLAILCRINATDDVEGGQTAQDAAAVASYLEKECGVDGLHLSRAVHLHDECMWAPSLIHGGFSADYVTEIKRAVSVPIITVGRYTEPQYAELMVAEGRADLVAFGRQSIADPEMPNKAKAGRLDLMNPCIGCLQGCVPNMFKGEPITCLVNPLAGREADFKPAQTKKNVMVIGGGPDGLYAAFTAAQRGHAVTLYEKGDILGGNMRLAAYPPGKGDITNMVRSYIAKCEEYGVKMVMNTEVTPDAYRCNRLQSSGTAYPRYQ